MSGSSERSSPPSVRHSLDQAGSRPEQFEVLTDFGCENRGDAVHAVSIIPKPPQLSAPMTNTKDLPYSTKGSRACVYVYTARVRSPQIASQVLAGRHLAESEGYKIIKTEIDGGRNSALLSQRDGLQRVPTAAGEGKFEALLIHNTDCLPRNPTDLIGVLTQLCTYRVEIHSVAEGVIDVQAMMRAAADNIWEGQAEQSGKRSVTPNRNSWHG